MLQLTSLDSSKPQPLPAMDLLEDTMPTEDESAEGREAAFRYEFRSPPGSRCHWAGLQETPSAPKEEAAAEQAAFRFEFSSPPGLAVDETSPGFEFRTPPGLGFDVGAGEHGAAMVPQQYRTLVLPGPPADAMHALISCGSIGHPQLCSRPCEWQAKGNCLKGQDCASCHLCVSCGHKKTYQSERDRKKMGGLSYNDRVRIFLPLLRLKAAYWNFGAGAEDFFAELAAGVELEVWDDPALAGYSCLRTRVEERFARCTFGEIVRGCFLSGTLPQPPQRAIQELRDAYSRLRASLCL